MARAAWPAPEDVEPPPWVTEALNLMDAGIAPESDGSKFVSKSSGLKVHTRTIMHFPGDSTAISLLSVGCIFVFHGEGEHCNKRCYTSMANHLSQEVGVDVHLLDMQAHGYSEAVAPHYIAKSEDLLSDAEQFIHDRVLPGQKFGIVSHSTGGTIALSLTLDLQKNPDFIGHYAMAPLIRPSNVSPLSRCVLSCLLGCCGTCLATREAPIARKTDTVPWEVFPSPQALEVEVTKDPLQWKSWTFGAGAAVAALSEQLQGEQLLQIRAPFRIVHGEKDGLVHPDPSQWLATESDYGKRALTASPFALGKSSSPLWLVPGETHLLLSGNKAQEVMGDMTQWFTARLNPRRVAPAVAAPRGICTIPSSFKLV